MGKTVLITGASGNLGIKLRRHFAERGDVELRLLCLNPRRDPEVDTADLAVYDEAWARRFDSVDAVVHLAGDPQPGASWESVQRLNLDLLMNIFQAAQRHRAKRILFASSNWVMAGYRFGTERLTTDLAPRPVNAYGMSKLVGERIGRSFAAEQGISFIALRIGYCQREPNRPGPHMNYGSWGQQMWLSDRDFVHAIEQGVTAEGVSFAVLNLMSDNPGMRWDLAATRAAIGYAPKDGHRAEVDDAMRRTEAMAAQAWGLAGQLGDFARERGW